MGQIEILEKVVLLKGLCDEFAPSVVYSIATEVKLLDKTSFRFDPLCYGLGCFVFELIVSSIDVFDVLVCFLCILASVFKLDSLSYCDASLLTKFAIIDAQSLQPGVAHGLFERVHLFVCLSSE